MSTNIKGIAVFSVLLVLTFSMFGTALAVHDLALIELDRNAADDPTPGEDWATLYNGGLNNGGSAKAFTGVLTDIGADGGTQFQGGGSKDNNDISQWLWKPGEPLDKDDITNGGAAAYVNTIDTGNNNIGDLIIYFGLDRFSSNGSAQIGFWFLQDPAFGLTNTPSGGGFKFSGVHTDNDILVQSNFSQGGVIDRITVYKWQSGGLVQVLSAADCVGPPPSGADDTACGTVNREPTFAPWPYTPKANEGVPGTFLTGAFFEGGINLTRLIPDAGCYTGFLAETRTSTPFDSRLKDFVTGSFSLCNMSVDKTGDTLSKAGDPADYTVTIHNTGSLTLYKDDISDSLLGSITENGVDQGNAFVQTNTCGASLAPDASCAITLRRTVLGTDPDPLPNTVTVVYRGKSNLSGTAIDRTDDHSVNLFQPKIAAAKTGDTLSKVGDDVNYTFTLSNKSSEDTPVMNCKAVDSVLGTVFEGVLPLGDKEIKLTRKVLETDPDPLDNTVTLTCSPEGFPNVLEAKASHSVNLFQPKIAAAKTGDALSKVGDDVDYTITLSNNSSEDTPAMNCKAVDSLLGTVFEGVLPLGDKEIKLTRKVLETDPDPLDNTVTLTCSPEGFPNVLEAKASHSVNLFQPKIAAAKTGDTLSKVGDDVNYTFTLSNKSSEDTPAMNCKAVDSVLGTVFEGVLPLGDKEIKLTRKVLETDPDPLDNTVTLTCSPEGFPNVLEAKATHSVNLFQPKIAAAKTGDKLSKVGDDVDYTITLSNNSSADTPALLCVAVDSLLGPVFSDFLPSGDTVINKTRTVLEGDPDPLDNTVTMLCSPEGFPNVLEAKASHSVNLFQPKIAAAKTGDALSKVGDDVDYTFTLSNNSSEDTPAMNCKAVDTLLGTIFDGVLPSGDTVINLSRTVLGDDPDPLNNTVTLTCSPDGFPNVLEAKASHETNLFTPKVEVIKSGPAKAARGEKVTYSFTINNLSSGDSPNLILDSVTDTVLGTLTAAASANCSSLAPSGSCSFTFDYTIQSTDPNPLVNVVTVHYHPAGFPNDVKDDDDHSLDILVFLGCTPGFWQGGAGAQLWNKIDDPQWDYGGTNPFTHDTEFNTFFKDGPIDSRLNGLTMLDLVGSGGTEDPARKAARDMVAAYLNESAFPADFPAASLAGLVDMWYSAVAGGDPALGNFHSIVGGWNSPPYPGYCPLP